MKKQINKASKLLITKYIEYSKKYDIYLASDLANKDGEKAMCFEREVTDIAKMFNNISKISIYEYVTDKHSLDGAW